MLLSFLTGDCLKSCFGFVKEIEMKEKRIME